MIKLIFLPQLSVTHFLHLTNLSAEYLHSILHCGLNPCRNFLYEIHFTFRNVHGNENLGLVRTPQHCTQWRQQFSSPSHSLQRDTAAMSHGLRELEHVSSGILQNGRCKWTQFR